MTKYIFTLALWIAYTSTSFAQDIYTPKVGSAERKAICNAFRVPMMKETNGQKVVFVIHTLKVSKGWAFINASLQKPNGKPVDWSKTKYHQDAQDGDLENNGIGLLKRNSQGKWIVLETSFNATDAWFISWKDQYSLPKGLMF